MRRGHIINELPIITIHSQHFPWVESPGPLQTRSSQVVTFPLPHKIPGRSYRVQYGCAQLPAGGLFLALVVCLMVCLFDGLRDELRDELTYKLVVQIPILYEMMICEGGGSGRTHWVMSCE